MGIQTITRTSAETSKAFSNTSENKSTRYSTVMLIDDNPLDIFVNQKLVESNGFAEKTLQFQEAKAGLEFLKNASREEWPEVIFLDIMMPEMDGFEFLDAFDKLPQEQKMSIKVIMLSTSESFKDLNRANKNPNVRKFLNKPLTPQTLQAIHV